MALRRNPNAPFWVAIEQKEREVIEGALTATGGNITRTAKALGIDRSNLVKIMKRVGVDYKSFVTAKAKA